MLFWILAALLTAATTALVLHPLMRRGAIAQVPPRPLFDAAVYRDQLAEVERDLARGIIGSAEAEAARAEIGRRLLAADAAARRTDETVTEPQSRRPRRAIAAAVVAVALPALALGLYLPTGRPDAPAQPFASRAPQTEPVPAGVLSALASLEAHIRETPGDVAALALAGETYRRLGRYADGAEAFRKAAEVTGGDPRLVMSYAETLTFANEGIVTAEAQSAFERVLSADPEAAPALYYLGLARVQAGDPRGGLERWAMALGVSPADAPWIDTLRAEVATLAQRYDLDPAPFLPPPRPPAAGSLAPAGSAAPPISAAPVAPSIDTEASGAIASLPPADQAAAIRSMVDRLAARLEETPGDIDGWLRLARARVVLGDRTAAAAALDRALAAAPEHGDALWARGELALDMGEPAVAAIHWRRLRDSLPSGSPQRAQVEAALALLPNGG